VSRESFGWAFLSALGAGFIVSATVELALLVLYPILFPPTREQPLFVPARVIWEAAAGGVAGAVAARAGGARAIALYVAYELVLIVPQLASRMYSCARVPAALPAGVSASQCDYALLITAHWTYWSAVAIGIAVSRWIVAREGANTVLRAAGVLAFATAVLQALGGIALFTFVLPNLRSGPITTPFEAFQIGFTDLPLYATAIGELVGGAAAGVLLARRSLAAPMLIGLALVGPSFAMGIFFLRNQVGLPPAMPLAILLETYGWLWLPLAGTTAVLVGWSLARSRRNHQLAAL